MEEVLVACEVVCGVVVDVVWVRYNPIPAIAAIKIMTITTTETVLEIALVDLGDIEKRGALCDLLKPLR